MSRSRTSVIHTALAWLGMGTIVATSLILTSPGSSAQTAPSDIAHVGRFERYPADSVKMLGPEILAQTTPSDESMKRATNGTLVGIPQRGLLFQVYETAEFEPAETRIAVRRMDTLAIIGTVRFPGKLLRGTTSLGGDWMHAFDGDRRIFFLQGGKRAIVEIDLHTFAVRTHALSPALYVTGFIGPAALSYDPYDKAVVILYSGVLGLGVANTETFAHRAFLGTDRTETRKIRSCNGPLPTYESSSTSPVEAIVTESYFYFACQRAGSIGAVVRIVRSELGSAASAEDVVVGPAYLETALADPASGRMFLITLGGEIWAFDTNTMAFIGVVAAAGEGRGNAESGYGIDTTTGRVFFLSSTYGLGVVEGRYFPIPQARVLASANATGQERIVSDPVSGRFFVLSGRSTERDDSYNIYRAGPADQPPPPADPDVNTIDAAEKEGVTESRYFANGTAYGFRTLLAKGLATVPPAPTVGQVSPTAKVINENVNSKCGYTDRELVGARISKAEYDSGSTSAKAVGFDVDDRTKVDLEHVERCDIVIRDNNKNEVFKGFYSTSPTQDVLRDHDTTRDPGHKWASRGSSCSSSAGGDTVSENANLDKSSTKCPKPGEVLTAQATASFEGKVSVGRTETKTTIKRTSAGVVSEVVSEAMDVKIGDIPGMGVVRIGEITAKATSRSNGRPARRDMSTHEVSISGVKVGTTTICVSNCAIDEVARRLTTLAGGRADFRTASGLDEGLRRGTPKGALTAVQKSVPRQASDQALVGDFTTEVPALEILVYNDNGQFGRARQLYQFAGVASAATYNITLLPGGGGFPDGGGFDEDSLSPSGGMDGFLGGGDGGGAGAPIASLRGGGGDSLIERVVRALARGIRMFFSNPRHALLLLTAWSLLTLPPFLSRRRRLLAEARSI